MNHVLRQQATEVKDMQAVLLKMRSDQTAEEKGMISKVVLIIYQEDLARNAHETFFLRPIYPRVNSVLDAFGPEPPTGRKINVADYLSRALYITQGLFIGFLSVQLLMYMLMYIF